MKSAIIAIPTLNEEDHIANLLEYLLEEINECENSGLSADIIIVDGGSTDRTKEISKKYTLNNNIKLIENPKKIQACAINIAAQQSLGNYEFLIRLDAHSIYPPGFIKKIITELENKQASSVVVSMHTVGDTPTRKAFADLFNSKLGNGGANHRNKQETKFVDHGHHAGFILNDFISLGGYDESFVANEDAEYDQRLTSSGKKILLIGDLQINYIPRATLRSLFGQYKKYGYFRFKNIQKHRTRPKLRQSIPVLAFISLISFIMSLLATPFNNVLATLLALPFIAYIALVILLSIKHIKKGPTHLFYVFSGALTSHLSFGLGFVQSFLTSKYRQTRT